MYKPQRPQIPIINRLLTALPKDEYESLLLAAETVELIQGKVLYEPGDIITNVYFPNDAAVSLLSVRETGATVEVGLIGFEGMIGSSVILASERIPQRVLVQIPGSAVMIKADSLREHIKRSEIINELLLRY